jgi:ribonuclease D
MRPPFIVDTPKDLDRFVSDWLPTAEKGRIALDLEEDRMRRYEPQIALIQMTLPDDDSTDVIIDPIALGIERLKPVVESLCSKGEVIMHGSRNDIVGLKRDFGIAPRNLRDTQVAARFLGVKRFGLAPMLDERFNVKLSKSARRSNWLKRPLEDKQIRYARLDTHYLCDLFGQLEAGLHRHGWYDAFAEECSVLAGLPAETTEFDPFGWRRIKAVRKMSETEQRRAAAIWEWRDQYSSQHNLHPNRVLPLWAIAQIAGRGMAAAEHGKIARQFEKLKGGAAHDLEVKLRDLSGYKVRKPRNHSGDSSNTGVDPELISERYQALRDWRVTRANKLGFDRGWLAPNDQLDSMSRVPAPTIEKLREIEAVRDWQLNRFGEEWLDILKRP